MKKKLEILMLLSSISFSNFSFGQNLVPNWSFEDTVGCPYYYNQIGNAVGWSSYRNTPDYYNVCSNSYVGVPLNDAGFQFPRNGNGYAGIVTYALASNYREFLGVPLIQPLIIGQKYFITFYVCRASGHILQTNIAANKIGIHFFTQQYSQGNQALIDNTANIYSDSVIEDTSNWTKIAGAFISDSAYQYLALGNFFQDSLTSHFSFDSSAVFAYYYVDDVFVSTDSTLAGLQNYHKSFSSVNVFPNPAQNVIYLKADYIKSLVLYDLIGNQFKPALERDNSKFYKISVEGFSKGIYYINIDTEKFSFIEKIIIIN
jgi:hypothetical protein